MHAALGIDKVRSRALFGKHPLAEPLFGRMEQDHVLVLPHKVVRRTCHLHEYLLIRPEVREQISL